MHAIIRAFHDAQSRRPYKQDAEILKAAIPPGGDWTCEVNEGAICRSVMWGRTEVAHMNPAGDLDDVTEGQIAMACRALPLMDAALRAIIVLAETADNLETIRSLAQTVIAFVEMQAPPIPEPDEEC